MRTFVYIRRIYSYMYMCMYFLYVYTHFHIFIYVYVYVFSVCIYTLFYICKAFFKTFFKLLLKTYKHIDTETIFIVNIFLFKSRPIIIHLPII